MASKAELRGLVTLNNKVFLSKMRRMKRTARVWAKQMQQAGRVVQRAFSLAARYGALAGAGIAIAVREADKFQKGMAEVSTMLGDNQDMLAGMADAIRDMAAQFGMPKETLTKGLYDILSAGIDASGSIEVLAQATKTAIGGVTDTATAVDALTTVINAYGLTADDAGRVSDILFQVVRDGKITFTQLAENIGKLTPTAKAAGLTLEEMGAMLATLVKVEKPERAMTALSAALIAAAKNGVDLKKSIRDLKGADLGTIMDAGFAKRSATAIAILSGNIDVLENEFKRFGDTAGAAEEAFKRMDKVRTFEKAWQSLLNVVETIGGAFRAGLVPAIDELAKKLQSLQKSGAITDWAATAAYAVNGFVEMARIGLMKVFEYGKLAFENLGLIGDVLWDGLIVGAADAAKQIIASIGTATAGMAKLFARGHADIKSGYFVFVREMMKVTARLYKAMGMDKQAAAMNSAVLAANKLIQDSQKEGEQRARRWGNAVTNAALEAQKKIETSEISARRKRLEGNVGRGLNKMADTRAKIAEKEKRIKDQHKKVEEGIANWQARAAKWEKDRAGAAKEAAEAKGREMGFTKKLPLKGIFGGIASRLKAGAPLPASPAKMRMEKAEAEKKKIAEDQLKVQKGIYDNTKRQPAQLAWA